MGIPFTGGMGFLLTATMGKLFTMTLGIQLTVSNGASEGVYGFFLACHGDSGGQSGLVHADLDDQGPHGGVDGGGVRRDRACPAGPGPSHPHPGYWSVVPLRKTRSGEAIWPLARGGCPNLPNCSNRQMQRRRHADPAANWDAGRNLSDYCPGGIWEPQDFNYGHADR
jgi:hypothetical protein